MEVQVVVLTESYRSAIMRFACSDALIDLYLQHYAFKDQEELRSICYLLVNQEKDIIGFFTLGTSNLKVKQIPFNVREMIKSPNGLQPILMIHRFAVGVQYQGKGFGRQLIIAALKQAAMATHHIGASAVFINQIDGTSSAFYQKLGFTPLPNQQKLFMPIKQLHAMFLPFH